MYGKRALIVVHRKSDLEFHPQNLYAMYRVFPPSNQIWKHFSSKSVCTDDIHSQTRQFSVHLVLVRNACAWGIVSMLFCFIDLISHLKNLQLLRRHAGWCFLLALPLKPLILIVVSSLPCHVAELTFELITRIYLGVYGNVWMFTSVFDFNQNYINQVIVICMLSYWSIIVSYLFTVL